MNKSILITAGIVIVAAPAAIALLNVDVGGSNDSPARNAASTIMADASDPAEGDSISKVNEAIRVGPGREAGSVKTVNGAITLGEGASARDAKTVNGSITISESASVEGSVASVNGGVTLKEGARVGGDVENVNGRITLAPGASVKGKAGTVNGTVALRGAETGGIVITNGNIELSDGAVVLGDLTVKKPKRSGFSFGKRDRPRVVIGENCEVRGTLHFEQEVELAVAESAKIGEITGEEPKRVNP